MRTTDRPCEGMRWRQTDLGFALSLRCIVMLALFFLTCAIMGGGAGGMEGCGDSSCFMMGSGCDGYCCASCYMHRTHPINCVCHAGAQK
jgi:hypothetical protein